MSIVMAGPTSTRSEWQPGHIPRLSYRNPLPASEQTSQGDTETEASSIKKPAGQGISIREIREALPREPATLPYRTPPTISAAPGSKSKRAKLGSLFAKEPSMAALDQVAQQMLAQHGCISPTNIPHVSSQKMPAHVPRVNSKWDGVPEHVKLREKQERERFAYGNRNSLRPIHSRSISTDFPDDQSVIRRRNSNAASTAESWDSRSSSSRPTFQDSISTRPESICSASSDSSDRSANRLNSATPHAARATPKSRSSDLPMYSLDETPTPPKRPPGPQSLQSASTYSTSSSEGSRYGFSPKMGIPSADTIPGFTSSSATTPLERSPKTPTPFSDDDKSLDALLQEEIMLPASTLARTPNIQLKTNDSDKNGSKVMSRKAARTGSALQSTGAIAPWETQEIPSAMLKNTQVEAATKSRGKGRLFGRDKR